VTDQEDRREESLANDETRYERAREAEERRRHEIAERLKDDSLSEPAEE
jgi:hypothetical protein